MNSFNLILLLVVATVFLHLAVLSKKDIQDKRQWHLVENILVFF